MSQSETAGPQLGQTVYYSPSSGTNYAALIVSVTAGVARLTTFPPGGTVVDQQNVAFDDKGLTFPSWRYPDIGTGI